eukprot:TRINITY_DN22660_c0_g1_i1.p1 TRINITY_DN22660_c0_g1~~TRINITY_DN22660_c0_g1_i1.p1  ORF type:complete len:221 (+),score=42.75 TRINITY_DN22660_c0_g1_i1:225-887(+)
MSQQSQRKEQIIHLVRHAEAEHNVANDWSIRDPPLTGKGRDQASGIPANYPKIASEGSNIQLLVVSPLRRTLQTALLGFEKAHLPFLVLAELQENCNVPCDTGRDTETMSKEFPNIDFSQLPPDWTSKQGKWSESDDALRQRAKFVRNWLRQRPESEIAVVTHSGFLSYLVPGWKGFKNAEIRSCLLGDAEDLVPTTLDGEWAREVGEAPADPIAAMEAQ